jgi:hypothetical protein
MRTASRIRRNSSAAASSSSTRTRRFLTVSGALGGFGLLGFIAVLLPARFDGELRDSDPFLAGQIHHPERASTLAAFAAHQARRLAQSFGCFGHGIQDTNSL